ncbi:glutamyl-tRNA(Gln) amidotransferase subunit C, mitochondrial [Toxorhynchites rutilus septentrionalis]|uniref:glutamyl-tRNA(Gln) amidotransferase subunit C, mitochondrial n=1 Tax=Toxorhynchites rutilus septentrionalis TaxID=329112 RepID=UPI00247B0049|nr:glutamyl-tRNA(Gln) amidotransferase subunit C, mitochondrial [Toxorhynchites rutilus septentrionalis]
MFRIPFRPSLVLFGPPLSRLSSSSSAKAANTIATASATGQKLDFRELKHPTKVPQKPHISNLGTGQTERISVDEQTVQLLERLSLVDLDSKEAHKALEDSIEFASRILAINTEGVEPLYTVLEQQKLSLREDIVTDGNILQDVLANARLTEEEYFVAPPGNIPLEQDTSAKREK